MRKVTIYGASDDLIEVEGDIHEEFSWPGWKLGGGSEESALLAVSDGTILRVRYDVEGCWRIERIAVGAAIYQHTPATSPKDDYSDRVTLTGDVTWIVLGNEMARA